MPDSAPGLNFIIVGASVSGLASAISLRKSGHNVIVLEKGQLGGAGAVLNGCARICPNGSKILLDWGLEPATRGKAAGMPGFSFLKYHAGERPEPDFLGENRWNEELLFEARGGYMQFRHQDLIRILYDEATKPVEGLSQVSVVFEAEVASIDCDACTVTLRSGETHTSDAIIGADGARGIVRQTLMEEEDASFENDEPTGMAVYIATIQRSLIVQNGLEKWFYDDIGSSVWCGSNRGAWIFPVGGENDLGLWLYTPDSTQDGSWSEEPEKKLMDVLGKCDERLRKLAALAGPAICVQLKNPYPLESWVSESGRVLVLGEAAHPCPPGGFHPYSIALEDAAFIGKIFSHTNDPDRISEFLYAFQEHREARCSRIREIDMEYIQATTMPAGEKHDQRDAGMRANHAAGKNAMEGNFSQMLEEFKMVFGYDAMDDADEWWINWGRFRDVAAARTSIDFSQAAFSSVTSSVEDGYDGGSEEDKWAYRK
ncbi:hypothetical protein B0H14DRAFT_2524449 [Mycena olivaceomarginata]|nr:hypothetical protein B0H14DRAFT_2524449 [Mycena olivaceomarginata]